MSEEKVKVEEQNKVKNNAKKLSVENIVGIVLIAVFLPVIIFNMVIVIKGFVDPNNVPTVGGFAPLIVGSDSMTKIDSAENGGAFNKGDMIIIKEVKADSLKVKDIITYVDKNGAVITHRIVDVIDIRKDEYEPAKKVYDEAKAKYDEAKAKYDEAVANNSPLISDFQVAMNDAEDEMKEAEGVMKKYENDLAKANYAYNTKGDFNSPAVIRILDNQLQGKYLFRIPFIGKVIEFFQTIPGVIVLIVVPVGVYFAVEMIRKSSQKKSNEQKIAELEAKLAEQQKEEEQKDAE